MSGLRVHLRKVHLLDLGIHTWPSSRDTYCSSLQRPPSSPITRFPRHSRLPLSAPTPPARRNTVIRPLPIRPMRIAPELPAIVPTQIFIPPRSEVVHLIAIPPRPARASQVSGRVPVHVFDWGAPVLVREPLHARAVPVGPVCTGGQFAVQSAAVAVRDDEDVRAFACQAVFDSAEGAATLAFYWAGPILRTSISYLLIRPSELDRIIHLLRLKPMQLPLPLIPTFPLRSARPPRDEGLFCRRIASGAEFRKEREAIVRCLLILFGVWVWMPPVVDWRHFRSSGCACER